MLSLTSLPRYNSLLFSVSFFDGFHQITLKPFIKNNLSVSIYPFFSALDAQFFTITLNENVRGPSKTTPTIYSQSWRTDFEFLPVSPDGVIYCAYRVKIRATLQCLLCYSLFFACRFPTISLPQRHCGRFLPPLPLRHLEVTGEMGVGRR